MNIADFMVHMQSAWYLYLLGGAFIGGVSWLHATYIKISSCVTTLAALAKEFENNGGSSLRDVLDRIEYQVNMLEFIKLNHLDLIDTPIFLTNDNGKVTWVNRAFCKLTGMTYQELLGNGWENMIFDDDRQRVILEWNSACKEFRPMLLTFRVYCNHQEVFNKNTTIVKCEAYGKRGIGYFGYIRDYKKN